MRRFSIVLVALVALALIVVACGGDDDDDDDGGTAVVPPAGDQSGGGGDDDAGDDDDDGGNGLLPDFGAGTAVLTIDGERIEPILENREVRGQEQFGFCRNIFGAPQVFGYYEADDGRLFAVDMWIPPTNWASFEDGRYDPPRIEIEVEGSDGVFAYGLVANPEREGSGQVDDYQLEGPRASGTVTFIDSIAAIRGDPSEPVPSTFEVTCG